MEIYTHPERHLTEAQQQAFDALLSRRAQGEPLAYLIGMKPFWTLELKVSPEVLIPRPETEHLIELVLERSGHQQRIRALDLGTGSGAIALALASERPTWEISATDISAAALKIAKENAEKYHLNQIHFYQSHWLRDLPTDLRFEVILANPPYLSDQDPHLPDLKFEPRSALVAGPQGLEDLREIIRSAKTYLAPGGYLALEHGHEQGAAVREIFAAEAYQNIQTLQDLAALDRITVAGLPPSPYPLP